MQLAFYLHVDVVIKRLYPCSEHHITEAWLKVCAQGTCKRSPSVAHGLRSGCGSLNVARRNLFTLDGAHGCMHGIVYMANVYTGKCAYD